MTDTLLQALRGARHDAAPTADALAPRQAVMVLGAGGALGSAVLAEALVAGRFQRVAALVAAPLASAVRGFEPISPAALAQRAGAPDTPSVAIVVFERERHSNGRDEAFVMPQPEGLATLGQTLLAAGVRRLVVVVPHAPALLPQALKAGFATLAEHELAALGFEQLVFVRSAQALAAARESGTVRRFAAWWLSQLKWMVPQREQPLRSAALALLVVRLARRLAAAPPGTRVLAPEALDAAATGDDAGAAEAALDRWLGMAGHPA